MNFIDKLYNSITNKLIQINLDLEQGKAPTYDHYKFMCGQCKAHRETLQHLDHLRKHIYDDI